MNAHITDRKSNLSGFTQHLHSDQRCCDSNPAGFVFQLFKDPLEKEGQVGGAILAQEEVKTIFGNIPDIYEVHTRIKVKPSRAADENLFPEKSF